MIDPENVSPAQVRAARALLNWAQTDLASAADVGIATLRMFEIGQRRPIRTVKTAIVRALEKEGVEFFIDIDRAGVSLSAKSQRTKSTSAKVQKSVQAGANRSQTNAFKKVQGSR